MTAAMMYDEDDFLMISGIQHFVFCRRQWALIHIESIWNENELTIDGGIKHTRAHDPFLSEKRGDTIFTRDMPVFSRQLGVNGYCDVVEFKKVENGVPLRSRKGLWLPCPIEYKLGKPKIEDSDRLQLCAQAVCLEEMLVCPPVETAFLYYHEIRRREPVNLDASLRKNLIDTLTEMRNYYDRRYTPRVKASKACNSCSLKNECLPKMPVKTSARAYIDAALKEGPD